MLSQLQRHHLLAGRLSGQPFNRFELGRSQLKRTSWAQRGSERAFISEWKFDPIEAKSNFLFSYAELHRLPPKPSIGCCLVAGRRTALIEPRSICYGIGQRGGRAECDEVVSSTFHLW